MRYLSTKLIKVDGAVSQYSRKYEFDGITFIHTTVDFGQAPAPYTTHREYVFVKKNGEVTQLDIWDDKNNLTKILPDGTGGYFLCSDYYHPVNSSRWSSDFASVYHYNSKGEICEIGIKDTNSITGIGVYGGKLYVKAMYYGAQKSAVINMSAPISTVNSGYYEYSIRTGEYKKIYPYADGELFFSPAGEPYCLTSCGMIPKLINLKTGIITPLD